MAEKEKINYIDIAKDILSNEISALKAVEKSFNEEFEKAVDFIYTTTGRIFVSGIGKSGQIGCKIKLVVKLRQFFHLLEFQVHLSIRLRQYTEILVHCDKMIC